MHTLSFLLADGVTIQLGGNVWNFSANFLIYLIVAAIVGLVAEMLVGWRLPFGFVGAIIAALVGVWLLTKVIIINGIGDSWQNCRPSPTRLSSWRHCRGHFLPAALFRQPHLQLSRQPRRTRDDDDDRESRDLIPVALSLQHRWGTRQPVRNMGSDREASVLPEPLTREATLLPVPGAQPDGYIMTRRASRAAAKRRFIEVKQ